MEISPEYLQRKLRVAVYDEAPFGYLDNNGQQTGVIVDLWKEIDNIYDFEYEFIATDMDNLLEGQERMSMTWV